MAGAGIHFRICWRRADDICYRIIDMEDARELRIISYADFKDATRRCSIIQCLDDPRL